MKNINSFKAIVRAIEYESARQIEVIENGGVIVQETRRWDDEQGESYSMRSKANAQDYRYFPDPDLLPIVVDDEMLSRIRTTLPELAHQKRERYVREGMSAKIAATITAHKNITDLFESIVRHSGNFTESTNLITGEIMRLIKAKQELRYGGLCPSAGSLTTTKAKQELRSGEPSPENLPCASEFGRKLGELVKLVSDNKINRNAYKEVVGVVFADITVDPLEYIEEKNLLMIADTGAAESAVAEILAENCGAVDDYRAGKQKAFGFLMGQAMKKLGGTASPDVIKSTLTEALKKELEI
jgi:aspartyl-tRNA(Asn)/glutamyl-tRNA(Gln) amidotransferase subunit B